MGNTVSDRSARATTSSSVAGAARNGPAQYRATVNLTWPINETLALVRARGGVSHLTAEEARTGEWAHAEAGDVLSAAALPEESIPALLRVGWIEPA